MTDLVCSASCGADLLALQAACELGISCWIVLPYSVPLFRARSVVDRGTGVPWGDLFDAFVTQAKVKRQIFILDLNADDPAAFQKANTAILERTMAIASEKKASFEAVAVWDGKVQDGVDITAHFVEQAQHRGMPVKAIAILSAGHSEAY